MKTKNQCWLQNIVVYLPEPANPEGVCLRQNGFFPHPDSSICNIFYNCVDGQEMEMACASGLHFDLKTGTCVWAENAGRPDCNNNANSKIELVSYLCFVVYYIE